MEKIDFTLIIDFDSTFVQIECLDELAKIALEKNKDKEKILQQIKKITQEGMEGKISFETSLKKRLTLFSPTKKDIKKLIKLLSKKITPSFKNNKNFFKKNAKNIYLISGGFKDYILPIAKNFGIDESHILANEFIFDKKGKVLGFNKNNPLSQKEGKAKVVKALNLKNKVFVLGDGYTDYEIKKLGLADKFFLFCENVKRNNLFSLADEVIYSFDEFLYLFDLPRPFYFPKTKIKVLLLENIHQKAVDIFKKEGYQVETLNQALEEKELVEKIKEVNILGIRSKTSINKNVIEAGKKLLTIGIFAIGTNQVDLEYATKKGIAVFNAPYSNTRSVVELTLGEIIMLFRRVFDKSQKLHQGIWDKSSKDCFEVRGKKLGIIGYGNIGSQLSVLAESLGMEIYFYDIVDKLPLGNAKKCQSLKELLKKVDVVTVHVDGRKENKNLIGEKEFQLMKDGIIFLNLSRGYVVDINALVKYIKNGKIKGAAVDVFPNEPKSNQEKFISPLQNLENVILTPHIGGSTIEAQANIADFVSQKIIDYINNGDTILSVNFPQIKLPTQKNFYRFIHIHQNLPGVLAQINQILSQNNINIEGQYLKTNEKIGYVITDVNKNYFKKIENDLKKVKGTIKFRILY